MHKNDIAPPCYAIGLMSGTSLDGIDAALIETNGEGYTKAIDFISDPYPPEFRRDLLDLMGGDDDTQKRKAREKELTIRHGDLVKKLLRKSSIAAKDIKIVGFHGQTLFHAPAQRRSVQMGDGQMLARMLGIAVINDFRSADVAAGGQGAPLVPLYHKALAQNLEKPLAILNIGGVANVTWIGENDADIVAFDTGPGNALLDDWVHTHGGGEFDKNGQISKQGQARQSYVDSLLDSEYFQLMPPKSLDRDHFPRLGDSTLALQDGAATLVAFTAEAVKKAVPYFPHPPRRWLVTGGGRHNPSIMEALHKALGQAVEAVETVGWNGDALEAEAFAYLAVRAEKGLALTLPQTTGVEKAMTGGRLWHP